ncbi:hypothetical protein AN958_11962 [Leucoagaricus sp. SymC.cos]|nr:hypothetical protein AN958_11962 [Leucoagaricus sp. SymC.cos]
MVYFLLKFKREFHHTFFPIPKLVLLSVETGAATAIAAMAASVLFIARRNSQYFAIPAYMLGKLYSNSLLRLLNSRILIGNTSNEPPSPATPDIMTLPVSSDYDNSPTSQQACSIVKDDSYLRRDLEAGYS